MRVLAPWLLATTLPAGALTGCGVEASFGEKTGKSHMSSDKDPGSGDATPVVQPEQSSGEGGEITPVVDNPDAPAADVEALNKCLAKWKTNAFGPKVDHYKKIVGVTVGGYGLPVNDTEATAEPELVLVYAAVNVNGAAEMNLMNPNGYYCMIAGVNVKVDVTVNLHCAAHLADPIVNVNVGSEQQDGAVAIVGVDVKSTTTVNTERPEGATCIR